MTTAQNRHGGQGHKTAMVVNGTKPPWGDKGTKPPEQNFARAVYLPLGDFVSLTLTTYPRSCVVTTRPVFSKKIRLLLRGPNKSSGPIISSL